MNNTLSRFLTPKILEALTVNPIVYLNGARQVGKSTLVQNLIKAKEAQVPLTYRTLDRAVQMAAAAAAPEAFLMSEPGGLVIDEVQLVPELFRALKVIVDESRLNNLKRTGGRYLLTGSANIMSLPQLSGALVGRMSVLTLHPFSTAEASEGKGNGLERLLKMDFSGINDRGLTLIQAIQLGTFPEIASKTANEHKVWLDSYLTTILQRDVRQLADLEKISALPTLLRVLAARAGGLINDSDISREVGLNSVTGKFYRNILKTMFLAFDVQPWHRNIGKRLVKAPKGYLIDTLLLCHMLEVDPEHIQLNRPEMFGHILENFVATELTKLLSFINVRAQLLHFRTSDGKEVDFVIERADGSIFAIEVKRTESVSIGDFNGIHTLAQLTGKDFAGGVILYAGKDVVPFGSKLWAVPFYILWQ